MMTIEYVASRQVYQIVWTWDDGFEVLGQTRSYSEAVARFHRLADQS